MYNRKGFTIAELLIAIVIIGVIASITIPTAINNISRYRYRSALKKSLAVTNNALEKHYAQTNLTASDYSTSEQIVDEIFKQQTVAIDGPDEFTTDDCKGSVFTTSDGMIFCVENFKSEALISKDGKCNYDNTVPCIENDGPNLWVDVNGAKRPNKITESSVKPKDIYPAQIYSKKVLPYGNPATELFYDASQSNSSANSSADNNTNNYYSNSPTSPDNDENNVRPIDDDVDINPYDSPENIRPKYDPSKWSSFSDFLKWLYDKFGLTDKD